MSSSGWQSDTCRGTSARSAATRNRCHAARTRCAACVALLVIRTRGPVMSNHDTDPGPVRQRRKERPPLPVVGQAPTAERSDAARNRKRVLDAAKKLFDERGIAAVTLDDVVAAAGVGKGDAVPPLRRQGGTRRGAARRAGKDAAGGDSHRTAAAGPGASPVERLLAFVRTVCRLRRRQHRTGGDEPDLEPGRAAANRIAPVLAAALRVPARVRRRSDAGLRADILLAGSPPSRSATGSTTRAGLPAAWPTPWPAPPSSSPGPADPPRFWPPVAI